MDLFEFVSKDPNLDGDQNCITQLEFGVENSNLILTSVLQISMNF